MSIEPGFFEAFDGYGCAILITAPDSIYLTNIAYEFCASFGVPFGKSEAGVSQFIEHSLDGRYGVICSVWVKDTDDESKIRLERELKKRITLILLPKLGIRIFSATPNPEDYIDSSKLLSSFSSNYGYTINSFKKKMHVVPRMGGDLLIEEQIGIQKGIMGACISMYFASIEDAIAIEPLLKKICLNNNNITLVNGVIASGSNIVMDSNKITAITNASYCPSLRSKNANQNQVPREIECISEMILNGFSRANLVKELKKVWQFLSSKSTVLYLKPLNFQRKLGSCLIQLTELEAMR